MFKKLLLSLKIYFLFFLVLNQAHAQLIQHLDASITSSVITDNTGKVTQWQDLSGNNYHAVAAIGKVTFPSASKSGSNLSGLSFDANAASALTLFTKANSTFLNQTNSTKGFSILIAFKVDAYGDFSDLVGNTSAVDNGGFMLRYSINGSISGYLGKSIEGESFQRSDFPIQVSETVVYAINYNAVTGKYEFWDSKHTNPIVVSSPKSDFAFSNLNLGSLGGSRFFKGIVGEVKVYDATLSDEDFDQFRRQLYYKWSLLDYEKNPPTPNAASFLVNPKALSSSLITMTATEGTDEHLPIEYFFTETTNNAGANNSGWQTSPTYRDGDLVPSTTYVYQVKMRDKYGNVTVKSSPVSVTTPSCTQPGLTNELEYGAFYGYQGWHYAPGDGRTKSNNWVHWFDNNRPDTASIHGDMWPDLREYDPAKLYPTQMAYQNGDVAKVYSSFDYSTIDLHVKWMKDYGLKGCVVQRFTNGIANPAILEQSDKRLLDVMKACEKYGIKFWVMHDAGGGDANEVKRVTEDWKHIVDDLYILQSPSYTYQNGLPVYGIWGVGVNTRTWVPDSVNIILDFYQNRTDKYKAYVVGGVPENWRTSPAAGWKPIFDRLDMISPWRTIFYDLPNDKQRMFDDYAYCNSKGIDYNPVVSPGASTKHLRKNDALRNWKPRLAGKFLWQQAYEVINMGSKFMYVAMFDEVDEGTAMYKMAETPEDLPVGAFQVPLNEDGAELPSDWYLRIGTEMQKMLDKRIVLTNVLPLSPYLSDGLDKSEWTTIGSSTNIVVQTANPATLKSGGYLEALNKSNTGALIFQYKKASGTFNSNIKNSSNGIFEFWFYINDVSKLNATGGQIEVSSSPNNDQAEYNWPVPIANLINGWNKIDLSFSNAAISKGTSGDPDLANIVRFRIYNNSSSSINVRIDDLRFQETTTSLPVTLLSYQAEKNINTVKINWKTTSEVNNNYFEIEKSTDGINFKSIGKVKAAQNSNSINSYSLSDFNPINGNNYYKLLQYDNDGTKTDFGIKAVKFGIDELAPSFVVYPNPASDQVGLSLKGYSGKTFQLSIYNLKGGKVFQQFFQNSNNNSISLTGINQLAAGQYIFKVTGDNLSEITKVNIR